MNTGNVPFLPFEVNNSHVTHPSGGGPCRASGLNPSERSVCDIRWSLSQAEVEMGKSVTELIVRANTTDQPDSVMTYSTVARISATQMPRLGTSLEVVSPSMARPLTPGETTLQVALPAFEHDWQDSWSGSSTPRFCLPTACMPSWLCFARFHCDMTEYHQELGQCPLAGSNTPILLVH